ncbi:MAG: hypothetical protein IH983_07565 [Planctomycetes bacterium]|nr:hypothetical protein [Planctomycetota bacterium]
MKLLEAYGGDSGTAVPQKGKTRKKTSRAKSRAGKNATEPDANEVDLAEIVNHIKQCDDAEAIEEHVLDKNDQVNRVLLPLYVLHEHLGSTAEMTSAEIHKVLKELGTPISQPNVSTTLSGPASSLVMGDKVRKRGVPVKYRIARRGTTRMKKVLAGKAKEGD